ncbi:MAG: hypothetical protein JWL69_3968 [Phycisphaerales bacterium]|nr:hypothetical protein [Phycisphaerales bacterium]
MEQAREADYIYTYICKFLEHFGRILGEKPWTITKDEITFANGSTVKFFSGGKSSANVTGYHPHVLQVDEGDKFSAEQFDGIANGLEGGKEYPSRFDVLSTNYTLSGDGVILKQIEKYEAFNLTKPDHLLPRRIFRICLIDILARCDALSAAEVAPQIIKDQAMLENEDVDGLPMAQKKPRPPKNARNFPSIPLIQNDDPDMMANERWSNERTGPLEATITGLTHLCGDQAARDCQ